MFVLRIEDTDRKRYSPAAVQDFIDGLRWLGLDWDEGPEVGGSYGPYFQSERSALYQEWAAWLVENDRAYRCFCTPEELAARRTGKGGGYDRRCRYLHAGGAGRVRRTGPALRGPVQDAARRRDGHR
ncbi:MAG: glutamate--tRNA ligase family protein [Anaerolineae bacterium]|nr:glutamate--tRNA ligase family protein [Anaerolineae bacterium]